MHISSLRYLSSSPDFGVTNNQKRWLVAGIALNKILVPQIRPFVEREVEKEYNNLKTSHNIDTQSSSLRLKSWSKFLLTKIGTLKMFLKTFFKYHKINDH